jgi:type I restriction enzyme S subunit
MVTHTWKREKLSNLADTCLGKMLDQKKNKGEYYPYLANLNVRWGSIELDDLREMRFEVREFERYGLKFGDIVMCEGGEPGRCALWKEQNTSMMIQKALHRIRAKSGVDSTFLYYSLLNTGLQGQFDGYFTGAAIKHLTGESLRKVELNIPSLAIQKKIAAVLSAYDDLIENNLERIKLLEEMAQITYEEWFVRMKFPGHEEVEVDSETGLPEGWTKDVLSQAINVNPRTKVTQKDSVPFVSMSALSTSSMIIDGVEKKIPTGGAKFINGDTLVARITPCLENGKTGFVSFLHDEDVATGSTEFIVLRETQYVNRYFIYCLARSEYFREFSIRSMSGSDGRQRVNTKSYHKLVLNIPPKQIMSKFEHIAYPAFDAIDSLVNQNKLLKEARDILLPRLMTGMIDIEQVELPEALLERINNENDNN